MLLSTIAKRFAGNRQPSGRRATTGLRVEILEGRDLPATLSAGLLTVEGTRAADTIRIRQTGGTIWVETSHTTGGIGTTSAESFQASKVSRIKVLGYEGRDTINAHGVNVPTELRGGPGADALYGGLKGDTIYGQGDDDIIYGNEGNNVLDGGDGDDSLYGYTGDDTLYGGAGRDLLKGNDGRDTLYGYTGDDSLSGGAGDDRAEGGAGADTIAGDGGADYLMSESGRDDLDGGDGADRIWGGSDADKIRGGGGGDEIVGGSGNDDMWGNGGGDKVWGEDGHDNLWGGSGNDELVGGSGNDELFGHDGDDQIWGQAGNDYIDGGSGKNKIEGTFYLEYKNQGVHVYYGDGRYGGLISSDLFYGQLGYYEGAVGTSFGAIVGPTGQAWVSKNGISVSGGVNYGWIRLASTNVSADWSTGQVAIGIDVFGWGGTIQF